MMNSPLVVLLRITAFIEEHPFWSFLIFILIFIYFVPIPYLHDFIRWITKSLWDFIGVGTTG